MTLFVSTPVVPTAVRFGASKKATSQGAALTEAKESLTKLLKQQKLPYEVLTFGIQLMVVVDQAEGKTDAALKAEVLNRLKPLPGFKPVFTQGKGVEEDTLFYNRFRVQISVSHKADLPDLLD